MTLTSEEINVLTALEAATRLLKYSSKDIRRVAEWRTMVEADLDEVERYLVPVLDEVRAVRQAIQEIRVVSCEHGAPNATTCIPRPETRSLGGGAA